MPPTTPPAPDPCVPSPCGVNADCTVEGSNAVCRCSPPFVGNPIVICERKYCSYNPSGISEELKIPEHCIKESACVDLEMAYFPQSLLIPL